MRRIAIAIAALLALALPGDAQVNPSNVPANTVIGRTGIGPGPAQAIPFAILTNNLLGSLNVTGDCTLSPSGVITCTKTNGTAFGAGATSAGTPANILNTQTTNYAIQTTDCGKTIQAGTGATGFFTVTLPAVAGFAANCVVTVKNADTGRAKALSGFPADMLAALYPLQTVQVSIVNGAWVTTLNPGQWTPQSAVTFFVDNVNGSDSNDCLAAGTGGACLTPNHAMALIAAGVNNVNGVTIQWSSGSTYTSQFVAQSYNGPGAITLDGNSSTISLSSAPGGCTFCIGSALQSSFGVNGQWNVRRWTVSNAASGIFGVFCLNSRCDLLDGMTFGTITNGSAFTCSQNANCRCANNITVTGTAMLHLYDQSDNSTMKCGGITTTVSNALVLTGALVSSHGGGLIDVVSETWTVTGSVTGTKYNADLLALIDSGACASIPGTVAGTPAANTLGTSGGYCNG